MYNMENRRSFFKGLAAMAAGVVGAKLSAYIPKKEEPKEELLVSSTITLTHDGKEYHPVVVEKTSLDKMSFDPTAFSQSFAITQPKPSIRKAYV